MHGCRRKVHWVGTRIWGDGVECFHNRPSIPNPSPEIYSNGKTRDKKWVEEYQKQHPDVQLSYKAIGSGESIKQFMAGVVDFGASDAAMSDEEMAAVARGAQ